MKQLGKLYLQENFLSGGIPAKLGECSGLEELVMSGKLLNGSIPSSFGALKSLKLLELSRNNLSGTIPAELRNLSMLNNLNLSFNHLHGEIPFGGVFSNITALSLYGNEDLCGGIPQLKLPACPVIHLKKAKKRLHLKVILIIVVTGAFLCSVISIIILYMTKKPKRGFWLCLQRNSELFQQTYCCESTKSSNTGSSKSFVAECRALARVRHRNLVKILTCCSSVDYKGVDFKALVFEFMPNGSLENWLHNQELSESENQNLNLIQRLDVAIDIAQALDYLNNDLEEVIVHCDIKPNNIFLDADMVAHLGDFGLARLLHETKGNASREQATSSTVKGTIGYIPPGRKPTDSMFSENLSLHKTCKMALSEGLIEQVDPRLLVQSDYAYMDALVSFARIGVACSSEFPSERMGIKDVIVELLATKKRLSCPQGITIVPQN
ncbi:hypothetical protein L6164_005458 [Bauhinia variegata]|uniref:Uncharacterized protein n=1 Tax=Bauhinia variegata TaxID=167791 RepID=A0ACB9PQX6_BAUVA|nr:hypothetical protein L6164_005458 [Bauhinia variegata]